MTFLNDWVGDGFFEVFIGERWKFIGGNGILGELFIFVIFFLKEIIIIYK
jgi:hypothetical protein